MNISEYSFIKSLYESELNDVYLVKNSNGKKYILKTFYDLKFSREEIKRELEIIKLLDHPNIVKIEFNLEIENKMFIFYKYYSNFACLIDIKPSRLKKLQVISDICNAIKYLHQNKIVHRDIKPDNIICSNRVNYLIDFGMAAKLNDSELDIQKNIVGTTIYMAPELWEEDNIDYYLADIYSLGITMYVIFNNYTFPYRSQKEEETKYDILNVKPKNSNCGNMILDKLIMKTISKNNKERPSIENIKETIDSLIKQELH